MLLLNNLKNQNLKTSPIVLTKRLKTKTKKKSLLLLLTANERNHLRGLRQTTCGQEDEGSSTQVFVRAALENLLVVRANSMLELTKASYHLGNRHVDLELHSKELFLLEDPVLAKMLKGRGLIVRKLKKAFLRKY